MEMPWMEERRARRSFGCDHCNERVEQGETYTRTVLITGKGRRKQCVVYKHHPIGDCPEEEYLGEAQYSEVEVPIAIAIAIEVREVVLLQRHGPPITRQELVMVPVAQAIMQDCVDDGEEIPF